MLQQIRDRSSGWVTKVIVAVVVIVFALFGLERLGDYFNGSNSNDAATVNGEGITSQSLDQEVLRLVQSGQVPVGQQQQARGQILEQMIQQTLLGQYARKGHMNFSNDQVDQLILSLPDFQDSNGKFSSQLYVQKLAQVGYTPDSFRAYLSREMTLHQLQDGIGLGSFVTPSEQNQLTALTNQIRTFRYAVLSPANLTAPIQASETEIQAYYQAHKQDYIRPAQVKLDYILLDKSKLADTIKISDDAVQQAYQQQAAGASREVSDIIVNINKQRDLQAAQARMKQIQALLAKGQSFASVAREYSDDKSSAQKGGSLGTVTSGIFGATFDSQVKALAVGQDSQPFQFDGALHLIRVTGIDLPPLDQLKGKITQQLQMQKVNDTYNTLSQQLSDKSFSASDLKSVADSTHLPLSHSDWLAKNASGDIFGHPGVMDAAFSDQVLNQGYNSDVINLGNDREIVLRVDSHRDQQQLPLDQVHAQVQQAVVAEKTHAALVDLANTDIAAIKQGHPSALKWQQASDIARDAKEPDQAIVNAAFSLPHPEQGQSVYGHVSLDDGQEAVISLQSVGERSNQGTAGQVANRLRTDIIQTTAQSLIDELTHDAKIVRH